MAWSHPRSVVGLPDGFAKLNPLDSAQALKQRVIAGITIANSAPTTASGATNASGFHFGVGDFDAIDLICGAPTADSYDVKIWWFYKAARGFVADTIIGTVTVAAGTPKIFPLIQNGAAPTADGVYVEVLNIVNACAANIWAQGKSRIA